ncbi:MAG TPA: carboxymuconolactone decarboxylase family protein [Acidimicrobiales bacterium]|nr:carboxymuconolactone decarboxylase family protein [Acidimicrobiales bacterium]
MPATDPRPRIAPGTPRDLGLVNTVIARVLGAATGGPPPNVFTTLGRNRRLFRSWLRFASGLMPGGRLPRIDTELVILRVAHLNHCEYEWDQHTRLARDAGLTDADLERVTTDVHHDEANDWTGRQALLLRVTDELSNDRTLSADAWEQVHAQFDDQEVIELFLLIGHYVMLAMTINALGIAVDPPPTRQPGTFVRAARSALERRGTSTPPTTTDHEGRT